MATPTNVNGKRPAENTTATPTNQLQLVEIYVGERRQRFAMNLEPICDRSLFFRAKCSNTWNNADVSRVELPDQDPELFPLYLESICSQDTYLGRSAQSLDEVAREKDSMEVKKSKAGLRLIQLWFLADYLMDSVCKNKVIFAIIGEELWKNSFNDREVFDLVYSTPPGSGLRRLVVQIAFSQAMADWIDSNWDDFPEEMIRELLIKFAGTIKDRQRPSYPDIGRAPRYYE